MRNIFFSACILMMACGGRSLDLSAPGGVAPGGGGGPQPGPALGVGGSHCGDRGDADCRAGWYCDFYKICGRADGGGICKQIPSACSSDNEIQCGCDGKTYPSPCLRELGGTGLDHLGECAEN